MKIKNLIIFILGIICSFALYGIYVYASGNTAFQSSDMDYTSSKTAKQAIDDLYEKVNSKVWWLTDNDHNGSVSAGDRVKIKTTLPTWGNFERTYLIYKVSGGYAYGIEDPVTSSYLSLTWNQCGPNAVPAHNYYVGNSGLTSAEYNLLTIENYNTYKSYFSTLQWQGNWWLSDNFSDNYGSHAYYVGLNVVTYGSTSSSAVCRLSIKIPVSEI